MSNRTALTTLLLAFLGLVLGIAMPSKSLAQSAPAQNTYTVHIDCAQGVIDAKHKITVTVNGPSGDVTVDVDVPALTDSAAVAGLIKTELELKGVSGVTVGETVNPKSNEEQGEDFTLPTGYKVTSAKVTKGTTADDGHLKVLDSTGKKISNP